MGQINKIVTLLVLTICWLIPQRQGQAQSFPDSILQRFQDYRERTLHEKIFVHLDQRFYLVGESLWFSVYCVDASFHRLLDVSKVVYVEILDKNNVPVLQSKVSLKGGRGNGTFYLPATVNSGNFTFRAYTQWMKNTDPAFYFHQPITIVNPFVKPEPEAVRNADLRVEFFPEGGNLVKGIRSVIGFRLTDANGKGVAARGSVLNSTNDTVAHFEPLKFGIGKFEMKPDEGPYHAVIKTPNKRVITPLPPVNKEGYVMSVKDSAEQWIRIAVAAIGPHEGFMIYLFGHARKIISCAEVSRVRNKQAIFVIDRDKLPEGITHFTVFNESQKPVCERLYFKPPKKNAAISAQTDLAQYARRRKVTLTITDTDGGSAPADVSIAVYKVDSAAHLPVKTIGNYLSLSSDLTGEIESEAYYMSGDDEHVTEARDNLMLTHGWRRFKWTDVFSSATPFMWIPEYRGHIVNGKIESETGGVSGVLTFLSIPGEALSLYASRSNMAGDLQFEVQGLTGPSRLIVQPYPSSAAAGSKLKISDPFSVDFRKETMPPFSLASDYEKPFLQRMIAMQAQDIFHQESDASDRQTHDSVAFYGMPDESYFLDDYTRFPVMEEVMREYVPGVFVRKRKDGFHFLVPDVVNKFILEGDPLILLDGVPLFDADVIMNVDPLKIRKLEVVKRRFFQGAATYSGIVSYTTYNGDIAGVELDPSAVTLNYEGLQHEREFVSPLYSTQRQLASRTPDRRYLLYWNPQTIIGAEGSRQVEFYTSDVPGRYQIIIQGLTVDGRARHYSGDFIVK